MTSRVTSMAWFSPTRDGVHLRVMASPNARSHAIGGVQEDCLKIRLQVQPIEGRANKSLVEFLSDCLKIPKSRVSVRQGQGSRHKLVEVRCDADEIETLMARLVAGI